MEIWRFLEERSEGERGERGNDREREEVIPIDIYNDKVVRRWRSGGGDQEVRRWREQGERERSGAERAGRMWRGRGQERGRGPSGEERGERMIGRGGGEVGRRGD